MNDIRKWELANYVKTSEDVIEHLNAAFAENDIQLILAVLGDLAKSEGMAEVARKAGVGRESLYKSLNPKGNPSFATIAKILDTLGLQIQVKQAS